MKRTRIVIRRRRDMDGVVSEIGAASEVAADISGGNGHVADSWILARSLTEHCLTLRNLSQKVSQIQEESILCFYFVRKVNYI